MTAIYSQRIVLVIDSARLDCYYSVWWHWWRLSASSHPQTLMYITRCLLLFQTLEYTSLPPSAAFLHSHRRCWARISSESRCLRNRCSLKVLHGIARQSDFWGASLRNCSPGTVTSSPAYCSPSIRAHQLRPSTSSPVPLCHLCTTTSWSCASTSSTSTTASSTSTTTWCFDRLLPEAVRLLSQRVRMLHQQVQLLGTSTDYFLKLCDYIFNQYYCFFNKYNYSVLQSIIYW
jgi:hypothetical protein